MVDLSMAKTEETKYSALVCLDFSVAGAFSCSLRTEEQTLHRHQPAQFLLAAHVLQSQVSGFKTDIPPGIGCAQP